MTVTEQKTPKDGSRQVSILPGESTEAQVREKVAEYDGIATFYRTNISARLR
jgi:hypothetical protein